MVKYFLFAVLSVYNKITNTLVPPIGRHKALQHLTAQKCHYKYRKKDLHNYLNF